MAVVEQEFGERLGQLGLADAGRAEEQEASPAAGSGPAGRRGRGGRPWLTAATASCWPITRLPIASSIASSFSRSPSSIRSIGMPVQRATTAAMSSAGHLLAQHRAAAGRGGLLELLLERGDAAILELAGLGEVARALRLLELEPGGVELLLDLGLAGDLVLLRLPALWSARPTAARDWRARSSSAFSRSLRGRVLLLLQRLALDLELDDPPVERLDLLGLRFDLHADAGWPPRPSGRSPCRAGSGR